MNQSSGTEWRIHIFASNSAGAEERGRADASVLAPKLAVVGDAGVAAWSARVLAFVVDTPFSPCVCSFFKYIGYRRSPKWDHAFSGQADFSSHSEVLS